MRQADVTKYPFASRFQYTYFMARRSLGKLDISVDFSRHLLGFEDFPREKRADFAAIFGRSAPLELEIGSGRGMFLGNTAVARPEYDFLGVEIGRKYAKFCAILLAKRGIENAKAFCGDAVRVLRELIDENTLRAVHVYFPDPWWKRAHRKRRVPREETLRLIESRLETGGTMHFRTDVLEYYQSTLTLVAQTTSLEGPFEDPGNDGSGNDDLEIGGSGNDGPEIDGKAYRTHFERRTLLHDEPVYRAVFRKT